MRKVKADNRARLLQAAEKITMGKGADSRGLAVHLLSATQGLSVLAHTFRDPELILMEAERLKAWIRGLKS